MRKLIAPDGYVYTNGETSGSIIYLGKNDKEENWMLVEESDESLTEATAEDYEAALGEMGVEV